MNRTYKVNTKEKIRDEAIKLFKEHGYNNVTIMQICEASGITKRAFYYHYKSKDQLISGVTDSMGMKAEQLISAMVNQKSNVGILWEIMNTYSRNAIDMGRDLTMQLYISEFKIGEEGQYPQSAYTFSTAVQIIENAQNSSEISSTSKAWDLAFALYNAFRGVTITWAASNGDFDLSAYYLKLFNVILGVNYAPDIK